MRILGIDPGIARTGWGCIDRLSSSKVVAVAYGCIETSSKQQEDKRLVALHQQLTDIILKCQPTQVAIEKLFFSTNQKTALSVGQARGVLMLTCGQHNMLITSYTPLQVKLAVTGYGQATKEQIQKMVKTVLGLATVPTPDDTADALAIAITHCFAIKYNTL